MRGRVTVVEYRPTVGFPTVAAAACEHDAHAVRVAVEEQGRRLQSLLRLSTPPLRMEGDSLIAEDIAGIVRLLPDLELEIAPKFLGDSWEHWREDFLAIANLTRSGRLLVREGITSSSGARNDLASLIAHTYVDLFDRNRRNPLRTYRTQAEDAWSLDGEVDAEDILRPGSEGYRVRRTSLTLANRYNAEMASAAQALAPEVRDGALQLQVRRISHRLGPQPTMRPRPLTRVPSRHSRWQECYDLAREIVAGLGLRLTPGRFASPGYVLRTWVAFEHLLVLALRIAGVAAQVAYHGRHQLGTRADGTAVLVEPDVVLTCADGRTLLLDAKYKGRSDQVSRISPADLYEALAFARAAKQEIVVLVYPRPSGIGMLQSVGSVSVFDEVRVESTRVIGVTVECRGISARGGFLAFGRALSKVSELAR